MNVKEQKKRAREFIERWKDKGNERQDSQPFWLDLLQSVYGVENPSEYITFEDKVVLDHTSFIDGFIDKTKVMIEQKGKNKDLNKAIKQSDGSYLTPFQQAKRYSANLPYSQRPRWIITSNFKEFYIYDMEKPNNEAVLINLTDLDKEFYRLEFLVDKNNEHIEREMKVSMQAGEIVGEVYSGLLKQYINPESEESLHAINQLIVRLVFCFYAEDAGIFGHKAMFHDYLEQFDSRQFRRALIELFEILDTPTDKRDPYLEDNLLAFPYVNGGMFAEKDLEIPNFTDELRQLILDHASSNFDWSEISPTIFGAVFESTLNPQTRRKGGMHYTSIENIHKVIDPLFMDSLREELNELRTYKQPSVVATKAKQFQRKLANLVFFDPACGSGNFLTETYISLRRLENEAIKLYKGDEVTLDIGEELVQVKLNQFYGIEINDFAVSVAKTALWIAESQMLEKTKEIVYADIDFLPLKSYTNIVEGNALSLDWESVVSKNKLRYIIGNPPFIGKKEQTTEQKNELIKVFDEKKVGNIDYVSAWYYKALKMIDNTDILASFVSTNSIVQGEQVPILWPILIEKGIEIIFAHSSFVWSAETKSKDIAKVHCVIIGLKHSSNKKKINKYIISDELKEEVEFINCYLVNAKNTLIISRTKPISNVPKMNYGSMPIDDGHLILNEEEVKILVSENVDNKALIRQYVGGQELLKGKKRWCLWLEGVSPSLYSRSKIVMDRLSLTKEFRESSKRPQTIKMADYPYLFGEIRQPTSNMLVIPKVSSEKRRYIPLAMLTPDTIVNGSALIIPEADLYIFGIMTSNVHMSWMRIVAGRMKSDYQYSANIVYNNFPWPEENEKNREKIIKSAQAILDARNKYSNSSLSELYDELTMPVELRKAHQVNDRAVMETYGMIKTVNGKKTWLSETETIAKLFEMYEKIVTK
ncbi:N-6 DNA methylase [Vagococcus carniphilus]|uniref:site-specific DNA-methyltransferase (adenine-specific) n=1 Tax=Vagococcus carniphilus TaxID=218144 RepID=A0AAW8U931_9ENTE|nr:DNA methyltransferase [Vagococcus carniphilus]MDT2834327.1 N-6 DNA methylase [Vagococcus carniphilus]